MKHRKTVEDNPSTNRPLREGSLVDRLTNMEVGEEIAMQRYLDPASDDVTPDGIYNARRRMVSTITKASGRLKQRDDSADFAVETGVTITSNNHIYAIAIITRNA